MPYAIYGCIFRPFPSEQLKCCVSNRQDRSKIHQKYVNMKM